ASTARSLHDALPISAALAQRVGGNHERIRSQLAHLVLVQLHDVETAEPPRGLGQGARDSSAVRFLCQEKAVKIGVDESGESAPQELRGLEIHLETRDE